MQRCAVSFAVTMLFSVALASAVPAQSRVDSSGAAAAAAAVNASGAADSAAAAGAAASATAVHEPVTAGSRVRVGVARGEGAPRSPAPIAARGVSDPNVLLMIIGGALFLAGIVIDDDLGTVVAVTGLAIGVYGLIKHVD